MPHIRKSRKNTTRHSRKSIRKTNKRRKSSKRSSRKMRGGCGCDKQQGGAVNENNLAELNASYPLSSDNQIPETNLSSRIIEPTLTGGRHKKYKKTRKLRGGAESYLLNPDAINSFGNSEAAFIRPNLMTNANNVNPEVYRQPVANTYGSVHSAPLV
jgi:hypothetical protein